MELKNLNQVDYNLNEDKFVLKDKTKEYETIPFSVLCNIIFTQFPVGRVMDEGNFNVYSYSSNNIKIIEEIVDNNISIESTLEELSKAANELKRPVLRHLKKLINEKIALYDKLQRLIHKVEINNRLIFSKYLSEETRYSSKSKLVNLLTLNSFMYQNKDDKKEFLFSFLTMFKHFIVNLTEFDIDFDDYKSIQSFLNNLNTMFDVKYIKSSINEKVKEMLDDDDLKPLELKALVETLEKVK